MKYEINETVSEIIVRSDEIIRKRERKKGQRVTGLLSLASILLIGALTSVISVVSINGHTRGKMTVMGAFLLPAEIGGYITVAIIAFAIGITVTLIALRYRKSKNADGRESQQEV